MEYQTNIPNFTVKSGRSYLSLFSHINSFKMMYYIEYRLDENSMTIVVADDYIKKNEIRFTRVIRIGNKTIIEFQDGEEKVRYPTDIDRLYIAKGLDSDLTDW